MAAVEVDRSWSSAAGATCRGRRLRRRRATSSWSSSNRRTRGRACRASWCGALGGGGDRCAPRRGARPPPVRDAVTVPTRRRTRRRATSSTPRGRAGLIRSVAFLLVFGPQADARRDAVEAQRPRQHRACRSNRTARPPPTGGRRRRDVAHHLGRQLGPAPAGRHDDQDGQQDGDSGQAGQHAAPVGSLGVGLLGPLTAVHGRAGPKGRRTPRGSGNQPAGPVSRRHRACAPLSSMSHPFLVRRLGPTVPTEEEPGAAAKAYG